jgi:class 3 adenylate cyclase
LEAQTIDGPAIRFGFGINTGLVLAGNVGSAGRSEYTVMGETVNTSSRLSGAAAGGEIWIGERTRQQLHERIGVDELPPQQLKGMTAPVACYRLHRRAEPAAPAPAPLLEAVR